MHLNTFALPTPLSQGPLFRVHVMGTTQRPKPRLPRPLSKKRLQKLKIYLLYRTMRK